MPNNGRYSAEGYSRSSLVELTALPSPLAGRGLLLRGEEGKDRQKYRHHRFLRHRARWYLADYCVPVSEVPGRQHLRSARCHQLLAPRDCGSTYGTRAFSVVRPTVWNSLPDHLRDPAVDSEQFRRGLKTLCSVDIRSVNALEVLRNCALQIDIYLLTYLFTLYCVN